MRTLILNIIDEHWRGHISALDSLRLSIGFRGMAQKNPKQEYKRESFEMFNRLLHTNPNDRPRGSFTPCEFAKKRRRPRRRQAKGKACNIPTPPRRRPPKSPTKATAKPASPAPSPQPQRPSQKKARKIRRNDPCPCNSGKKYKHCCGKI